MKKLLREVLFFGLSCLSLILCLQALPLQRERGTDDGLAKELSLQKENELRGRRELKGEEEIYMAVKNSGQDRTKAKEKGLETDKQPSTEKDSETAKAKLAEPTSAPRLLIKASDGSLIDLNSAVKDELVKLNGIGPKLAEKIIVYREENGVFLTLDDLLNVSGIGPKKLDKIKLSGEP